MVALSGYSMVLSALELGDTLRRQDGEKEVADLEREWSFDVVPCFSGQECDILSRAFAIAFRDRAAVQTVADFAGVSPEAIRRSWPKWMQRVGKVSRHFRGGWRRFSPADYGLDQLP